MIKENKSDETLVELLPEYLIVASCCLGFWGFDSQTPR